MSKPRKIIVWREGGKIRAARREAESVLDNRNSPRFNAANWKRARLALKVANMPNVAGKAGD